MPRPETEGWMNPVSTNQAMTESYQKYTCAEMHRAVGIL